MIIDRQFKYKRIQKFNIFFEYTLIIITHIQYIIMDQHEEEFEKQQQQQNPTQLTHNTEAKQQVPTNVQSEDKKEAQHDHTGKKDPETLSEGERMGLSKQQLRKLEKKLEVEAKKKKKEEQAALKQAQKAEHKDDKKQKGKKKQKALQPATPQQIKQFNEQKIPLFPNKNQPIPGRNNVLITSALPYVNNVPHLGNIIGCVLSADVFARFKRLQGDNVLYICGTDEYGTATQVKALQQNKTPQQICDHFHAIHKNIYEWFDIGFDYFGRTSTPWHATICQQIFLNIQKNGKILKEKMTQCYCQKCDLSLADRFIGGTCPYCQFSDARGDQCDKCQKLFNSPTQMKNLYCTTCKSTPVQKQTEHFFIDLPQIQGELQKWIGYSSVDGKWSQNSIAVTKGWLNMGLKPKCITRDLKWGVSLPIQQYKHKVFYVWFDAPIGYISITANLLGEQYKKWWRNPKQVKLYQFMGKDNVPFHTVIFPSSLIAANDDWTLLHHISTTQYLNYQSGKFSKRNGTGVFGDSAAETGIPSQVWRYYLLVNRPEKSDSQFSWNDFIQKNKSELLANVGNLVNRVLKFCYMEYDKTIPKVAHDQLTEQDHQFLKTIKQKYEKYVTQLNNVQIKQGLRTAMEISSLGNKYLQESKFWESENKKTNRTQVVMGVVCNFIRLVSLLFEPYMPSTSAKINYLLGLSRNKEDEVLGQVIRQAGFGNIFTNLTQGSKGLKHPIQLFTEYTPQQAEHWRAKFQGNQPHPVIQSTRVQQGKPQHPKVEEGLKSEETEVHKAETGKVEPKVETEKVEVAGSQQAK